MSSTQSLLPVLFKCRICPAQGILHMDRINMVKKFAVDGYKLLTVSGNHALYSDENGKILLCIRSQTIELARVDLKTLASSRAPHEPITNSEFLVSLQDLIQDSLYPITESADADFPTHAVRFFSSFSEQANWESITPAGAEAALAKHNLEALGEEQLLGLSSGFSPGYVFLRRRYPNLRFEISLEHTGYELRRRCRSQKPFKLTTAWKCYTRPGSGITSANPLVATGYLLDTIKLDPLEGHSVVSSRKFVVDRLISPEHFKPVVLPLVAPAKGGDMGGAAAQLGTLLRESNVLLSSLLAVSALLASINPMLAIVITSPYVSGIVQLAVASIGSVCAIVGMVVMVLTKFLDVWDRGASGLAELAGNVAMTDGVGDIVDPARVSEREILDGSIFAAKNLSLDNLLKGAAGSLTSPHLSATPDSNSTVVEKAN